MPKRFFENRKNQYRQKPDKYYIYSDSKKTEIPKEYKINRDVHIVYNPITEFVNKLFKGEAFTLGNKIYSRRKEYTDLDSVLIRHEMKHIEQSERVKHFLLKYFLENIKQGHKENRYEKEANYWESEGYRKFNQLKPKFYKGFKNL